MSLHIESTEEAALALEKQRKKTLFGSLAVTLLGATLFAVLFIMWKIYIATPEQPEMVAYATQEGDNPDIDTPEVTQTTQRPSSSAASSQVKVIAAVGAAEVAVVNPDIDVDMPSEDLSMGLDIGDGFGTGVGDGDGGGIPGVISKRCDLNDRMKRIMENGGVKECEDAVVKSLRWLQKQQNQDGSWGGKPQSYSCAMTGLALLAYMAHCETPLSEEFGETVLKGISYLVDVGNKSPVLSKVPQRSEVSYDHAVATYALCEAYTFCKQMNIPSISSMEEVVVKAVDKIISNQNADGGWAYNYDTKQGAHTDLSVTGWNVQALKAAEHGGIKPSKGSISGALRKASAYCRKCAGNDGLFGYMPEGYPDRGLRRSLVGVGILSLQMCGDGSDSAARKGLEYMQKDTPEAFQWSKGGDTPESMNLYQVYYGVQAAMNRGGEVWTVYNKAFRDATLKAQNSDGSFKPNGYAGPGGLCNSNGSTPNDIIYRQCLATLMLEVYYRFLPGTGEGTKRR